MTNTPSDFRVSFGSFDSTEITVEALSQAGRLLFGQLFGAGAVSATMPKSRGPEFAAFIEGRGLAIAPRLYPVTHKGRTVYVTVPE